jgi:hypothetical protein
VLSRAKAHDYHLAMILDTLSTTPPATRSLNSRFAKTFAWLRTFDGTQAIGRHDIDGDALLRAGADL